MLTVGMAPTGGANGKPESSTPAIGALRLSGIVSDAEQGLSPCELQPAQFVL